MDWIAAAVVLVAGFAWLIRWVHRWRNPRGGSALPPGSMGLPFLGETLDFLAPGDTQFGLHPFVDRRMKRYGSLFKTSLVGHRIVVSTDTEINSFVFQQEEKLFRIWYPPTMNKVLGPDNMITSAGVLHKYIRNLVLRFVGAENLREVMLGDVQRAVHSSLSSWSACSTVDLTDAIPNMVFGISARKLITCDSYTSSSELWRNYSAFMHGLVSFPLNIPGTAFHKCMQGRENVIKILQKMFEERKSNKTKQNKDFFDVLIDELAKGSPLTEGMALDLMFMLLYVSFETTSLVLMVTLKLLMNHPKVMTQLMEEHDEILKTKDGSDSCITWEDYKLMKFTIQVINESVRLANIAPVMFRKALKDVHLKGGYMIPSGWSVMICPSAVHLNPEIYEDPLAFNPWRWKDKPELNNGSKNFMAFGGGVRFCVGAEYSRLLMSIFLHCLITNYRWKLIRGGKIIRSPGLHFPEGFHVQFLNRG